MSDLFKTYKRHETHVLEVATITEENISQIAALVKGSVDYSGDAPVLIDNDRKMTWKIGWQVSYQEGVGLINQNGFNSSGHWEEGA